LETNPSFLRWFCHKVDVPMASAASSMSGPGVGEESKKTDLEMVVVARILHQEAAMARILL
jgi:hypothetical protein